MLRDARAAGTTTDGCVDACVIGVGAAGPVPLRPPAVSSATTTIAPMAPASSGISVRDGGQTRKSDLARELEHRGVPLALDPCARRRKGRQTR
jgi:hypothetical protein